MKFVHTLVTFVICCLLGTVTAISASEVKTVRMFSNPDIITSDYSDFCMDRDGFLWIATDGGLFRFDGSNYDIYRHDDNTPNSISDNRVLNLLCDSKGRLWAATANGLNLYDPLTDSFSVMELPDKLLHGYIIGLTEQKDGTITFIVSGIGLYIIDFSSGTPTAVRYLSCYPLDNNFNSLAYADGMIYAGTHDGKVAVVAPNGKMEPINVSSKYITRIIPDSDGNMLVTAVDELYRINRKTNAVTRLKIAGDKKFYLHRMSTADNGYVYIGTDGYGIWQLAPGSDTLEPMNSLYTPAIDINSSKIGAVYTAPDGNLWLGCNLYGVVMVPSHPITFSYHDLRNPVSGFRGGIRALSSSGEAYWVSMAGGRAAEITHSGRILREVRTQSGEDISSIISTNDGNTLFGVVNDGIWKLAPGSSTLTRMIDIPGSYPNIYLCETSGGEIFAAVHGVGLMRHNPSTGSSKWYYSEDNKEKQGSKNLSNTYFASFYPAKDNKIWIGLYGGLACFDLNADSLVKLPQAPFLKGVCFAMAGAPGGHLFIGSSHGLLRFNAANLTDSVKTYTTLDGLADNDIRSLMTDNTGKLWIGTMFGISSFDPAKEEFISYYGGHGLFEKTYLFAAKSDDGKTIYFGNRMGITAFKPTEVAPPGFDQNISVSAIYVNGVRILRNSTVKGKPILVGDSSTPSQINLSYKDNSLSFRLSTMDFRDAANVRYKWRLEGYHDTWMKTRPGESVINLPHLDPGKYVLRMKACENNVSSPETEIIINISSPWYFTTLAKIIYLLIIVGIVWLIWLVMKKKRDEKINDAKVKFFIDISHELRSPMTLIISPLERMLKKEHDSEDTAMLKAMHRNAQRILSLVNQLLDLRKIDKGKMKLKCTSTDLSPFIGELVDMFKSQASDKDIDLEFKQLDELPHVWVDRDNFDKILVNLISNSIKYTPKGGKVIVSLGKAHDPAIGDCAEIKVTDTGIGLDNKTIDHVFERFYRARENHSNPTLGFGIGLDLCRQLTLLHHGSISADNRNDGTKGSIFTVRLPLGNAHLSEEEIFRGGDTAESPEIVDARKRSANNLKVPTDTTFGPENEEKHRSSSRKILIVDDDMELREYLKAHLSLSYKVLTAPDGVEAMKLLLANKIDLIVSDVMMPEMDGLALLKTIRSNVDTHHIPVILLSSKNDIADRMAGWDRGADGYIGKPFNIEELDSMIENLIDSRLRLKGKFSGIQNTHEKIAPPEVKGNDEALMEKIMKIINERIDDPMLNVEKLGQEAGISRAHLHRKMKEIVGMTPSDFIRNIRLQRACEVLKNPDVDITQVAYTLGFTSQPHFSTAFKRFTGMSPTEYRMQNIDDKAKSQPEA